MDPHGSWKFVPYNSKKKHSKKSGAEVPTARATYHGVHPARTFDATTANAASASSGLRPDEVREILHGVGIIELNVAKASTQAMYTCAEARAVAGLIRRENLVEADVPQITVATLSSKGFWTPCANCQQWLDLTHSSEYRAKVAFPSLK